MDFGDGEVRQVLSSRLIWRTDGGFGVVLMSGRYRTDDGFEVVLMSGGIMPVGRSLFLFVVCD